MATKSKPKKAASKKAAPQKTTDPKPGAVDTEKKATQPIAQPTSESIAKPPASDEVVVFAIRIKRSERDAIHAAAGAGKASEFVRGIAVAAARGDLKAVTEIFDAVHAR